MPGGDELFAAALRLEDLGRPEEALEHYARLLAQSPGHADAWHNRGILLARLGRLGEAERSHREFSRHHPGDPRADSNLADVLLALSRYAEAVQALDRALRRAPGDASVELRKGVALACLGRFAESRQVIADARARSPREVEAFMQRIAPGRVAADPLDATLSPENIFLARRFMGQEQCEWADWPAYVEQMRATAADPGAALEPAIGFMAQHMPLGDAQRHSIMRAIAAPFEARFAPLPPPAARARPRIRVGVLSPDFHDHLNAYLLRPLFELADRQRFEMYAYSLGPDDGSEPRARIKAAADAFRDLRSLPDREAALAIRRDDVDILLDVGGHTTGGRFAITAQRPARVQVNYLGYPSSLGSKRVDYAIVDRVVAPQGADWSETLVHLPHTFFLYDFRLGPTVKVARHEYGLPQDAFVFCAFHKAAKITPETFDLWAEVLRQAPRSLLWFGGLEAAAVSNLRRHAAARGVDPGRLVFAPREPGFEGRYLARQALGDLMLDAVNHNAITTACDALGMGLPLLTLKGFAMSCRAGESMVRAAGLPELVAADRNDFVSTAVRLASDRAALGDIRKRLRENRRSAPLFDVSGRVRELEAAFERML